MMTAFGTPEMSDAALRIGAYRGLQADRSARHSGSRARGSRVRYFFTLKLNVTVNTNGVWMPFITGRNTRATG
jgi:hypothetical protein